MPWWNWNEKREKIGNAEICISLKEFAVDLLVDISYWYAFEIDRSIAYRRDPISANILAFPYSTVGSSSVLPDSIHSRSRNSRRIVGNLRGLRFKTALSTHISLSSTSVEFARQIELHCRRSALENSSSKFNSCFHQLLPTRFYVLFHWRCCRP